MRGIIYYFSGTGNSLKVAKDVARLMGDTEVRRIERDALKGATSEGFDTVGIVFPVYYYGLPKMVEEFLEELQISLDAYVFAIATCGGSVGAGLCQLERIMEAKGISLGASYKVKMPDNYQIMYSPPTTEKQKELFRLQEEKIADIAREVRENKTKALADEGVIKRFLGGMVYKVFKPHGMDANFWTDDKCNGCGICVRVCPAYNISLKEEKPSWSNECQLCLACMHWCPKASIQYKKGTIKRRRYQHPQINVKELFLE